MSESSTMKRFWDERARENAYYFINNKLSYLDTDAERFWASGERDVARLLDEFDLEIEGDETVLEIGSGIGRMTRPMAARAERVIGLDVSEEMLRQAREENADIDNVEWLLGDGRTLAGVDDGSVDVVLSFVVLQHIPEPEAILSYVREMGRVLRPGGWTLFQVSNDESIHAQRSWDSTTKWRNRLRSWLGRSPRGQFHPAWLGCKVEVDAVRSAAAEAGMELERVFGEGTQYCMILARAR